jgi:hypothetical protein
MMSPWLDRGTPRAGRCTRRAGGEARPRPGLVALTDGKPADPIAAGPIVAVVDEALGSLVSAQSARSSQPWRSMHVAGNAVGVGETEGRPSVLLKRFCVRGIATSY